MRARVMLQHAQSLRDSRGERIVASKATLLLVDDDATTTGSFAQILQLHGYAVRTALTADDALRQAEREPPDAVISDLRMPLLDGLDFLRRLRARPLLRATPVAIVTGDYFLDELALGEIERLGARLHFKPLWLEDVVAVARDLLH